MSKHLFFRGRLGVLALVAVLAWAPLSASAEEESLAYEGSVGIGAAICTLIPGIFTGKHPNEQPQVLPPEKSFGRKSGPSVKSNTTSRLIWKACQANRRQVLLAQAIEPPQETTCSWPVSDAFLMVSINRWSSTAVPLFGTGCGRRFLKRRVPG